MSCDILDNVADEIRSDKPWVHPSARWVNWPVELHVFVGLLSIRHGSITSQM